MFEKELDFVVINLEDDFEGRRINKVKIPEADGDTCGGCDNTGPPYV